MSKRFDRSDKFITHVSDVILTQCVYCTHWVNGTTACDAFPGKIPDEILANNYDHRRPWISPGTGRRGDRGISLEGSILFEPKPVLNPDMLKRLYTYLDRLHEE